jgi:nucleoside-diphosphate-sugar epimerase
MKILITGGAGFIGSHVCEAFSDHEIHVAALPQEDTWRIDSLKTTIHRIDLKDSASLKKIAQAINPSAVIHLAANIDGSRDPSRIRDMINDNAMTTLNILQAFPQERMLIAGTVEEYGRGKTPFFENSPEDPVSPYSLSKTISTRIARYFQTIEGRRVTVIRPFLTYGPRQADTQLIPAMIRKALANETIEIPSDDISRDLNYAPDIARGIRAVLESDKTIDETINICSGKEYRFREIAELIIKLTNSSSTITINPSKLRKNEVMGTKGDNTKLRKLAGWTPQHSIEEGLKKTIEWYRTHHQ